jgi:hypothetical protein
MLAPDTVRAQGALRLLQAATERGLDRDELLALAGLNEAELVDPDRHLSLLKWVGLWREVCDRIPDPDFGLEVGRLCRARAGGVLGCGWWRAVAWLDV